MGFIQRFAAKRARRSALRFWAEGVPILRHDERPVNYGHFIQRAILDQARGTLFVTDQRVIWRMAGPDGFLPSAVVEEIKDVVFVGKEEGSGPGEFGIIVMRDGQQQVLALMPGNKTPMARTVCESVYEDLRRVHAAIKKP